MTEYKTQAEEMADKVVKTRDDYDKLLQMVQRQAQVDEVRLSRLHADLASAQGRSVMIFTVFTVIFLPLTFFTGLFGMNTQEWGGENNLSLKTIGYISLPASVALIVVSLVMAWSTNVRRAGRAMAVHWDQLESWIYSVTWTPLSEKLGAVLEARRQKADARNAQQASDAAGGGGGSVSHAAVRTKLSWESSDFWQRHRMERDREYRIPEVNKRDARKGKVKSKAKE